MKKNWDQYSKDYKKMYESVQCLQKDKFPRNTIKYFYYDESDNIRNFNVKKGNYNANYLSQFTLGGIASETLIEDSQLVELYDKLCLQKNVKELKSHNILNKRKNGIAQFESEKLHIMLNYLLEKDYYLHYSTMNVFYFGIVADIIDSLIEFDKYVPNEYSSKQWIDLLKSYLYKCMIINADEWGRILSELKFPNLTEETKKIFLCKLYDSVYRFNDNQDPFLREKLLYLIKEFPTNKELIFLSNNMDCILIESFPIMYLHKLLIYDKAFHFFDEETEIMKYFVEQGIDKAKVSERYKFIDSSCIKAIQVSDVCVGVICVLYKFFAGMNLFQIKEYIKKIDHNSYEYRNMKLLAELMLKTVKYDEHLILQMSNYVELEKYNLYLNSF